MASSVVFGFSAGTPSRLSALSLPCGLSVADDVSGVTGLSVDPLSKLSALSLPCGLSAVDDVPGVVGSTGVTEGSVG